MIKTTKEIINQAKKLAQCKNSDTFDFAFLVSLANSTYTNIYNDLTSYSNSFIDYFKFTGKEADLPSNCYKVLAVYRGKEDNPYLLSQSSVNNFIPGTYYLENNTIRIVDKNDVQEITVKYSTLPMNLTAPCESIDCQKDLDRFLSENNFSFVETLGTEKEGLVFTVEDQNSNQYNYIMDPFKKEFIETISGGLNFTTFNNLPLSVDIANQTVELDGKDITSYFTVYDTAGNVLSFDTIISDNMHLAIRYGNGDIYVMSIDFSLAQINPFLYKGRYYGVSELIGLYTDDETGYGIWVVEPNAAGQAITFISHVPDTIVDYPDNVFFDYLEDKIAIQLQGLVGLSNDGLREKLQYDEQAFYTSLQRSSQGNRIKNVNKHYRAWW